MQKTVDIVTMGCSKNLVDSERLIRMFGDRGYVVRHNPDGISASTVVINTCGFIGDAKMESVDMILQCCGAKADGLIDRVYVMGCLSERYASELPTEIPEVDGWFGKFDWDDIFHSLDKVYSESASADTLNNKSWRRTLTTPSYQAYLKIAEGCNRYCAFCAIPLITGRHKSRPIEEIVEEVRTLVAEGVKEFNVIAQELTYYGIDLYGERSIAKLIDAIAAVPGVEWIRLHYAYPSDFPDDLLDAMARNNNVCRYLDIALQHISDKVLDNMHRHITGEETRRLLAKIREKVPGIHIRTTLMVGFPGEGEEEFRELMDFVREQRFERMGAFAYSEEEGTFAAKNFEDDIPEDVKQYRLDALMNLQAEIASEHNEAKVGTVMTVIIDSENDEYYIGRTEFDSPEVDPEVFVEKTKRHNPGDFINVKITQALPYDLIGQEI